MSASSPDPTVPALEMDGVEVSSMRNPSVVALEGVHWTVVAGDYWTVGGLNRSGKSDLMAVAAGLTSPAAGTLRWFGRDPATETPPKVEDARQRAGLVFDGGQLFHHLTLAENIALPLLYHLPPGEPEPADRIRALIELTGLAPWIDQRPAEVSRNWQQRIGLARALALRPRILLLDNPLTGLDPRDAVWWLDRLDELSAGHPLADGQPLTLIVTADDLRPWIERARQFAVVHDRKFLALGGRAEVLEHAEPLLTDLLRRARPISPPK